MKIKVKIFYSSLTKCFTAVALDGWYSGQGQSKSAAIKALKRQIESENKFLDVKQTVGL